jgi:predicted CXXCH cytochrome family protein
MVFVLLLVGVTVMSALAAPPTVSIINPKPGTSASPAVISPTLTNNNFKVQIQVWNKVADITGVAVGYYQGAAPDTGSWTWGVNATLNSNYNCGTNCGIYDAVLSLAGGDYYLMARAVSTANGTGYSKDNRTGNNARYVYIRVGTKGAGTGMLLARDSSSQLCTDCHSLKSHSSQSTGGKYQNWQLVCLECHLPHNTKNISLIKETITTPKSGSRSVVFYNSNTGDSTNNTYVNAAAAGATTGICQVCHTQTQSSGGLARWRNSGNLDIPHYQSPNSQRCTTLCHTHENGFTHSGGSGCEKCHGHEDDWPGGPWYGTKKSHATHTENDSDDLRGPNITCADCHDTANYPTFKDGATTLTATTVCDTCHSPGGYFDGVNDSSMGAKLNWSNGVYAANDRDLATGKEKWCISCHDNVPAVINGQTAQSKAGDNSTYGYYIRGHGRSTAYAIMSWQETSGGGNPGANVAACTSCHDSAQVHISSGPASSRLKAGYENDQTNSNCKQCHNPGIIAVANPKWYTTYAAYSNSAHGAAKGDLKCTACHEVHGAAGAYAGMTKASKQNLCNQCHSATGGVINNALSNRAGYVSATNIQDAFGKSGKHPLGKLFSLDGNVTNYTLECTTCHNVHIVTGKYWEANQSKSPITKFTNNLAVWGASAGQKMSDYAGSGVYVTPYNDVFAGSQLPDYATFCLECHAGNLTSSSNPNPTQPTYGLINWNSDPHGLMNAGPSGQEQGLCPNWFDCGMAYGWDGDDRVGTQAECWPVISRGQGRTTWGRGPYTDVRFNAGNAVMACIDCHEAHGSNRGSFVRERFNTTDTGGCGEGSNGTNCTDASNWNSNCNACHWYYGQWHAGMGCGNASCHAGNHTNGTWWNSTNNPHGIEKGGSSTGPTNFNRDLVLDMRFENNLKDSGTWQLDGKWYSAAGSFAAGKFGQAAVLSDGKTIQVGTEDSYWSTDEGKHGTWKFTEMKYNTTLEAWVYPTDNAKNEYTIFRKHTGYDNGGYGFSLKKVNGTLRTVFNCQIDNNGFAQGGAAGVRGAYSSVGIPLNKWTHVAATFDTNGPDRNPSDLTVGRIRIYVNGEDVTTSDSSGNNMQPGASETSIFAYSENSPWNQSICYNGEWCASEFSIGGFDWEATNFIGRIDEAKVWNVTKNAAYFAAYDSQAGPYISYVEGLIGSNQLTVTFSEGVYTNTGSSGALVPADFVLTDTGGNNPRTTTGVTHTAGSSTAIITMSQPLVVADVNADTLAAASNAIFDNYNIAAGTEAVIIGLSSQCPTAPVSLELNESSGSTYVMDTQNILYGAVNGGAATLTGSAYSGGGDGSGRYIDFEYNTTCLQASTAMTIETRIKPTGIPNDTTTNYVRRILDRSTGSANYQLSVWRSIGNSDFPGYSPGAGVASIALWVRAVDDHGYGDYWKVALTNYTSYPIVSDHWYQVKAVWNTSKASGIPVDIYVDDLGTDGNGAGENWSGYVNCTNSSQSYQLDKKKLYTGDIINTANGAFTIGTNSTNHANNLFNGLIDWIKWKPTAD